MRKSLFASFLLLLILAGLSSSSFHLNRYLTETISLNQHTTQQLAFAISQENEAALVFALKNTEYTGYAWQALAKKIAKTQGRTAYHLAEFFQYKKANNQQAILWYQQAIRLQYDEAFLALAQLYYQQDNWLKAQQVLSTLPPNLNDNIQLTATILAMKIAITVGDLKSVNALYNEFNLGLKATNDGVLLLKSMKKYQVLPTLAEQLKSSTTSLPLCSNSIQLFATNLDDLSRVEQLIQQFSEHPLSHSVCFSSARYIPITKLNCTNPSAASKNQVQQKQAAISCNELIWHTISAEIDTRFIAIMLPEGGANVHLGILYFDAQDSVDVLSHEISHLLGFVDEYPLVKNHLSCEKIQEQAFSQNIAILSGELVGKRHIVRANILKQLAWASLIKESTPILHKASVSENVDSWQLGTPKAYQQEVGLFGAETCDEQLDNAYGAFKPLGLRTQLQYFALDFPSQYLTILAQNKTQLLMPSFHYNIALAYFLLGDIKQANVYLKQAASWETKEDRRKKILQGDYY